MGIPLQTRPEVRDELGAVSDAELSQEREHVDFDRLGAAPDRLGDDLVARSACEARKNANLAVAELHRVRCPRDADFDASTPIAFDREEPRSCSVHCQPRHGERRGVRWARDRMSQLPPDARVIGREQLARAIHPEAFR